MFRAPGSLGLLLLALSFTGCPLGGSHCDGGVCIGADGGLVVAADSQAVTRAVTRYSEAGAVKDLEDFGAAGATVPSMWVKNGNAFTEVKTGAATAKGTFLFSKVPAGERYVRFGGTVVVNPSNPVSFERAVVGRRDAARTDGGTVRLFVNSFGLSPWVEGSDFQFISPGASAIELYYSTGLDALPDAGSTPSLLTFDHVLAHQATYGADSPVPLPDTTKGDQVWLSQMESLALPSGPSATLDAWHLVKGAPLSPLTMAAGASSSAVASFGGGGGGTFNLDWRRGDFWALSAQVNPSVRTDLDYEYLFLDALPYTTTEGAYDGAPDLVLVDSYGYGEKDTVTASIPYANPYPAAWSLDGRAEQCFSIPKQDAGVEGAISANGCIGTGDLYPAFGGAPLRPTVSPPTNLQFDGRNGYSSQPLQSLTPSLTWSAPTMGTPSGYRVSIRRVKRGTDGTTGRVFVLELVTRALAVTVPPGVLQPGGSYYFWVTAVQSPIDPTAQPLRDGFPSAYADALSGLMQAP